MASFGATRRIPASWSLAMPTSSAKLFASSRFSAAAAVPASWQPAVAQDGVKTFVCISEKFAANVGGGGGDPGGGGAGGGAGVVLLKALDASSKVSISQPHNVTANIKNAIIAFSTGDIFMSTSPAASPINQ